MAAAIALHSDLMSQDGAEPAAELPVLKTHDAHTPGTVTAAWLAPKEPNHLAVLTAGAEGVLAERQIRPTAEVKWKTTISKDNPVNALAMSPDQTMAAVVVNRSHVKVWGRGVQRDSQYVCQLWPCNVQWRHRHQNQPTQQLPACPVDRPHQQPCTLPAAAFVSPQLLRLTGDINDIHDSKLIMKFTGLPTHCCAWGRDGKHVLAAGDDGIVRVALMPACKVRQHTDTAFAVCQQTRLGICVKINHDSRNPQVSASELYVLYCAALVLPQVMAQMKVEAFMRGAAMDPEGQYAAAATADGQLYLWDLKQIDQNRAKEELKKSITCKVRGSCLCCGVLRVASDEMRGAGGGTWRSSGSKKHWQQQ